MFIVGRQHSGNTLLTEALARLPGCYAITNEGMFFDRRPALRAARGEDKARGIVATLKLPDADESASLCDHLARWLTSAGDHLDPTLGAYREAMDELVRRHGCRFWAQKGTSYLFSAGEILRDVPDARLVCLVRNPYDLAASKKRRNPGEEWLVGTAVGWNRGIRTACALHEAMPQRVQLLRYEALAEDPEAALRTVCDFLQEPFNPAMLDVPHINPAEDKYAVVAGAKGINRSRVFYYRQRLGPSERAALDAIADRALVDRFYPDLPHAADRGGLVARVLGLARAGVGALRYAADRVRWARSHGLPLLSYFRKRLLG